MKKKLIRLTEQDLHRMIMRSVNKVLKEGFEPEYSVNPEDQPDFEDSEEAAANDDSTVEQLTQIRKQLAQIMDSGFIPFSSPAPSSTEQNVRDAIMQADSLLGDAIQQCMQLGY